MSQRLLAVLVVDLHQFALACAHARSLALGERQIDSAFRLWRCAHDDRPIELLGLSIAEGLAQTLGRLPGPRDQQQARRVLVEAVDKSRALLEAEAQRIEHSIHMPVGPRP